MFWCFLIRLIGHSILVVVFPSVVVIEVFGGCLSPSPAHVRIPFVLLFVGFCFFVSWWLFNVLLCIDIRLFDITYLAFYVSVQRTVSRQGLLMLLVILFLFSRDLRHPHVFPIAVILMYYII